MMKKILQSLLFVLLGSASLIAQVSVSGTVTSNSGEPLIGVNILEVGTSNGTVTDLDGNYTLSVPEGASLEFSYTGHTTQQIAVDGRNQIDVVLQLGVALDEVVVTALGISRDKKAITYAAQNAEIDGLSEARPTNMLEGLSGNVAGISVGRVGSGVSGAAKVILRGNRSIAGSSQPLYVVDGVTLGGDISNLSADDIESITVLKGANAAALYGSRANNGVIVVTTKMGRGKEGYAIDLNTSYMAASPIYLNNFQNEYGQGSDGVFNEHAERSWGPRFDGSAKPTWSNNPENAGQTIPYAANPTGRTSDFFQTGHNFSTNVGISTRSENTQAYFSYTFTDAEGVVPLNAMQSHNLNVRMNTKLLDRLTLDTKVNYIRRNIDNIVSTGDGYQNEVRALYKMPANIRTEDVSDYEFTDPNGVNKQHFWQPGLNAPSNPYWALHNITNDQLEERVIGLISLKYDITENLSILGRSSIDRDNFHRSDRYSTDSYIIADLGFYQTRDDRGFEWNSDFLINYNKDITSDFSVDISAGGAVRRNEGGFIQGNPRGRDSPLNVPNLFSYGNTSNIQVSEGFSAREIQSLYGFATIGWKNAIYLDVTGRNDWSSTLSAENRSFFYPSVGLTVVASDLMSSTPSWLSLLKIRGSYAEVGNDTDPYNLVRSASVTGGGRGGFLSLATTIPLANLLPEKTKSLEIGADIRLFKNRLGLDLTYYKSNTTDQLFPVSIPIASGATSVFTNGADVQNTGFEAVVTGGILRSTDFSWDVTLNFAANDSEVLEIAEGFDQLDFSGGFFRVFRVEAGQPWGNLYSRGFARDAQGRVIVEADGLPRITSGLDALVANFNPDWLAGLRNAFSYKNLSLNFLIDVRQGGTVASFTNAIMWADGATEATLAGRDGGLIFGQNVFENETAVLEDGSPNNIPVNSEKLWTKLGGRNSPVAEAFVLDASNARLREVVLGYSLPSSTLASTPFTSAKISFVGRNLFFIYNKAENVDPEVFQNTGRAAEGTENFGPPTAAEYGVNLKFGF